MQKGYVYQAHGAWHIRYRLPNGEQKSEKLADYNEQYRTKKSVRQLADDIIHKIYAGQQLDPSTVQDFIETRYLPHAEAHLRPSTYRGYRNIYNRYKQYLAGYRVSEFKIKDGQSILSKIAAELDLTRQTLINIRNFMRSVFRHARRQELTTQDPWKDVEVPRARLSEDTIEYSAEDVDNMVKLLDGMSRLVVIVAANTALSLAELQGLQWTDITDDSLTVNRTVWHGRVGETKTKFRRDSMPLLPVVKQALDEHRKKHPNTKWVFEGPYLKPIDLATYGTKHIKPILAANNIRFAGYHGFRRGFGTRLADKNIPPKILQSLLRHSNISVTMKHYVKAIDKSKRDAISKLEA